MNTVARNPAYALAALSIMLMTSACTSERDRTYPGGIHPDGWTDKTSSTFHGDNLRQRGFPLAECRQCHGETLQGGAVDVACSSGECHSRGIDFCGTCHGSDAGPLPSTGAHALHEVYCDQCHVVPQGIQSHPDGTVDLVFGAFASAGGFEPTWVAADATCEAVYCHQGDSPNWNEDVVLDCDGCHRTSEIHARFIRVVAPDTCADCHDGSPAIGHLDGVTLIGIDTCDACHGEGVDGAPPPGLDGAMDPTAPNVGAHVRHLDRFLPDRIGKVARCDNCHPIPDAFDSPGHMDQTAPADLAVLGGGYDSATQACTSWCHMNGEPTWTDVSGNARACDACHSFPPVITRDGATHPTVPDPTLAKCQLCHSFSPDTHVNGEVTF